MAEALVLLGVADNIVQFVDCGIIWAWSAKELYTSGNGALQENAELEMVITNLRALTLDAQTNNRLKAIRTWTLYLEHV
jgi:hypothetical protein